MSDATSEPKEPEVTKRKPAVKKAGAKKKTSAKNPAK